MHSSDGEPWTLCCSFIFAIITFGEPTRVESSSLSDFSVSSLLSLPVDVFSSSSSPSSRSCNHSNQVSYTRKEPSQYSVTNSCVIPIFLSKSHLRPVLTFKLAEQYCYNRRHTEQRELWYNQFTPTAPVYGLYCSDIPCHLHCIYIQCIFPQMFALEICKFNFFEYT